MPSAIKWAVLMVLLVGSLLVPARWAGAGYFNCEAVPYLCYRCTPPIFGLGQSCYPLPYGAIGSCVCVDEEGGACYVDGAGCQAERFDY
jgi:hypothetical protein